MKSMNVKVFVTLKPGVLDPEGKAVQQALHRMSYGEVEDVRIGKYIQLAVNAKNRDEAEARVGQMCERLLANTVIESYSFEINE